MIMLEEIMKNIDIDLNYLLDFCTYKKCFRKYRYKGKFKKSRNFFVGNPVKDIISSNMVLTLPLLRKILTSYNWYYVNFYIGIYLIVSPLFYIYVFFKEIYIITIHYIYIRKNIFFSFLLFSIFILYDEWFIYFFLNVSYYIPYHYPSFYPSKRGMHFQRFRIP